MKKNYLITLRTVARMDEDDYNYYKDNPADLHAGLTQDDDSTTLSIEETDLPAISDWSANLGEETHE